MSAGSLAVRYESDGPLTYVAAAKVSKRCCAAAIAVLASCDPLSAGVDFLLGGGGVVPCSLHVDDRFVDAFLLGLDGGAEVLELLVGVGDGGDESADDVRTAGLRDGQGGGREQHSDDKRTSSSRPEGCVSFDSSLLWLNANVPAHSWAPMKQSQKSQLQHQPPIARYVTSDAKETLVTNYKFVIECSVIEW